jgi:hypothetical protein
MLKLTYLSLTRYIPAETSNIEHGTVCLANLKPSVLPRHIISMLKRPFLIILATTDSSHAEIYFLYNNTFNPWLDYRVLPQQIPSMLKLTFLPKTHSIHAETGFFTTAHSCHAERIF